MLKLRALALVAALMAGLSPAIAQQFPTVPDGTVIGRVGTGSGSGPSQAIKFSVLGGKIGAPYVVPASFGAKCDGVTDDATALQNMINVSGGLTIFMPAGGICATSKTLNLVSNLRILGGGRDVSAVKGITNGTNKALPVFKLSGVSNVEIADLGILGSDNVTSWSASLAGAISIGTTSASVSNLTFRNLRLAGFNSTYWIYGAVTSFNIFNITIDNVWWQSTSADIPTDGTSTNNANYGLALFGGAGGVRIENTVIRNSAVDGTAFCIGLALFNNHYKYSIQNNRLLNVGATNTVAHCTNTIPATNSYAAMVYDSVGDGNPPVDGLIQNNYILNPYSAGLYFAGDGNVGHTALSYNNFNVLISGNEIVGQSAFDTLLPRGAIAIADATNFQIGGNKLYGNYNGVIAAGQWAGFIDINANTCLTSAGGAACVDIVPGAGTSGNTPVYAIKDNLFQVDSGATSAVIRTHSNAANYYGSIDVTNNKIAASDIGANFSGVYVNKRINIQANHFSGIAATSMLDASAVTGGPVVTKGNVFDLSSSTTGAGMKVNSSLAYMSEDLFMNRNSGSAFAYSGVSATGTIHGFQFSNVATANQVVSSSLGTALPNFSAAAGDYVQNLLSPKTWGWSNPTNGNNWVADFSVGGNLNVTGTSTLNGIVTDGNGELMTNIAAPATPAAGLTRVYVDATQKVLTFKNDAGTVGNAVVPSTCSSSNWFRTLSAAGVLGCSQPALSDISGFGTGVATALGVNVGTAGSIVVNGGVLGTPSSGVGTNLTGTAAGLTAGHVTTNANMTGDVTSVGNATTLAAGNAGNLNSGTLLAARMPALTGGCTTSAGAVATSCTINTNMPFAMGAAGVLAANSTVYIGPAGTFGTIEAQVQTPVSAPITLKNFYAVSNTAPSAGQTYTLTVRKNGVSTAVTCQIAGASATSCNDTTHSVAFAAADLIDVLAVSSVTASSVILNTMATAVTTSP